MDKTNTNEFIDYLIHEIKLLDRDCNYFRVKSDFAKMPGENALVMHMQTLKELIEKEKKSEYNRGFVEGSKSVINSLT